MHARLIKPLRNLVVLLSSFFLLAVAERSPAPPGRGANDAAVAGAACRRQRPGLPRSDRPGS